MLDLSAVRQQFPAFAERYEGAPAVFFDNPGGTQVHASVVKAMSDYLTRCNANTHGVFATSRLSDARIDAARAAAADLLGATAEEIVFGNNMTSLTFMLSRSLAAEFGPDDEIVVTRLDHDANVWPWVMMAEDTGARVRWAEVDLESCTLDMAHLQSLINERTRLVAVGYASNAVGTLNDVRTIVGWAKAAGASSFIDAVQYAPHGLIDVQALDCDFLACSASRIRPIRCCRSCRFHAMPLPLSKVLASVLIWLTAMAAPTANEPIDAEILPANDSMVALSTALILSSLLVPPFKLPPTILASSVSSM